MKQVQRPSKTINDQVDNELTIRHSTSSMHAPHCVGM